MRHFLNNSFTFAIFNKRINNMTLNTLYTKALSLTNLTIDEGVRLFIEAPPSQLFSLAQKIRFAKIPEKRVS